MTILLTIVFTLLGIAVGSFLNVCIDRLPLGKSLTHPPSHCDRCGEPLRAKDLVPILSFLWLKGRCRYCGARIPWRSPLVELLSALLFAFSFFSFGISAAFAAAVFYGSLFLLIIFVDLEHHVILTVTTYPVAVLTVIVFTALNWFLRTEIGLALRATGDNEQMIRGLGGNTDMTTMLGVSMSNGFVAIAGALIAQNQGFTDVGMGIGMIVMGLASVIIGEGLFRPKGVTTVLLAVFGGAFVYRLFLSIALRLGLPPTNLKLITAVLVIVALSIPFVRKKLRHEWIPPAVRM